MLSKKDKMGSNLSTKFQYFTFGEKSFVIQVQCFVKIVTSFAQFLLYILAQIFCQKCPNIGADANFGSQLTLK